MENDILQRIDEFSKYLKEQGLKITNQRVEVARKIFGMDSHFTVDHLAHSLHHKSSAISRATIYRIVSVMVSAGLLTEHDFGKNAKIYEHIRNEEHHDHLICLECGHITEFNDQSIEDAQIRIASDLGFDLKDHSLNMYANCRSLKEKGYCSKKEAQKDA